MAQHTDERQNIALTMRDSNFGHCVPLLAPFRLPKHRKTSKKINRKQCSSALQLNFIPPYHH